MSDLIKREDVQREIQASFDGGAFRWQDGQDLMDRINALPTASPWHRVELEEPTKAGWYLVMDVDGDFNVDEWHNTFGWQFVTPSDADRITYWMPIEWMPIEPPKEDA